MPKKEIGVSLASQTSMTFAVQIVCWGANNWLPRFVCSSPSPLFRP